MSTFQERLEEAMGATVTAADLARECSISRAAVSKWFGKGGISPKHLFTISRFLRVDAEWLATGEGRQDRGTAQVRADLSEIPARRLELIRAYGKLPEDVRLPIRILIETLAAATSDRYAAWTQRIEDFNHKRDAATSTSHRKKTPAE